MLELTVTDHTGSITSMSRELVDNRGNRKYLTQKERDLILKAAELAEREVRTFLSVLLYTGCRIQEPLDARLFGQWLGLDNGIRIKK